MLSCFLKTIQCVIRLSLHESMCNEGRSPAYMYVFLLWCHHVNSSSWRRHQRKYFPCYWPFVQGIHRLPVNSPCKGQWRGALMFSVICAWINGWVNNREADDLGRHQADYDVTAMSNCAMSMLWHGNTCRIIEPLWGESIGHRVSKQSFDNFVVHPNKLSNKQYIY